MTEELIKALQDEIQAIADENNGRITPELVVRAAKANKKSLLHKQFTWDEGKAAQAYWIEQARTLIRRVRVEVVVEEKSYSIPAYIRDPGVDPSLQGYISVEVLKEDQAQTKLALFHEFAMAKAYLDRAEKLSAALSVQEDVAIAQAAISRARQKVENTVSAG